MKKNLYNLIWAILFSWMVILGTTYAGFAGIGCGDSGYDPCCKKSHLSPDSVSAISAYGISSHSKSVFFIPASKNSVCKYLMGKNPTTKKDFCCKTKACLSEEPRFLNSQHPYFKLQSFCFADIWNKKGNKERTFSLDFDQQGPFQPIPIYTLTQSFLC